MALSGDGALIRVVSQGVLARWVDPREAPALEAAWQGDVGDQTTTTREACERARLTPVCRLDCGKPVRRSTEYSAPPRTLRRRALTSGAGISTGTGCFGVTMGLASC